MLTSRRANMLAYGHKWIVRVCLIAPGEQRQAGSTELEAAARVQTRSVLIIRRFSSSVWICLA